MLTLLYKGFDLKTAPKINVVINNFSKINPETNKNEKDLNDS